jgi:protein SCO1
MPRAVVFAALAGTLAAAGLGAAAWFAFSGGEAEDRFADCRETTVIGGSGDIGGPFTLVNSSGEEVVRDEVIDRPSLVYFGYTFCPDVCPLDVARNAEALEILGERGVESRGVFITVDPARDTPRAVGDFASNLGPRMVGLTGSDDQIETAKKAYKAYGAKVGSDPQDYLVDHSTFTYLMAPGEGFLDLFRRDMSAEAMADRVQCYAERL